MMGKRKSKRHSKSVIKSSSKSQSSKKVQDAVKKTTAKYNIDDLLNKAEEYIDTFEYVIAQKFCQRALEIDSDHPRALELSGSLLLEGGNSDSAKQCFGRAVEVNPDVGHTKYLSLAQLLDGADAVQCYQKGIELMMKEREEEQAQQLLAACGDRADTVTTRDISSTYCAMAEIYMTDCCFEDDAESRCKECIDAAIAADNQNPESYQLMASLLISQENKEEAKTMINKSVSLWLPKRKEAENGDATQNDDPPLPFDSRITAAKILTEVEEYETAKEILEMLLDEDDEAIQVWYLLGWANYLQGAEFWANARYFFNQTNKIHKKSPGEDEELIKHVTELLQEVGPGDDSDDDADDNADKDDLEIDSDSGEDDMDLDS